MLRTGLEEGWDPVTATRIWLQDQASPASPVSRERIEGGGELEDDDGPGVVDLLADMETAAPRMKEAMDELSSLTRELAQISTEATERIKRSDAQGRGMAGRLAIVTEYTHTIDPLVVRYDTASRSLDYEVDAIEPGLDYLLTSFDEGTESSDTPEARQFLEAVAYLGQVAPGAIESMEGYHATLGGTEDLSRILRPKVRVLRSAIERTIQSFQRIRGWGDAAGGLLPDDG